jgi:ubiquinone/menaquinone biosynthesis C-methylase UbiE
MDAKEFYSEYYKDLSTRAIEWRELSGRVKANNIVTIVGDRKITNVLEIGAGTGAILSNLVKNDFGARYFAIDVAQQAIEFINNRRDIPKLVEARVYDGVHIPYYDQQFDLAILSHVIEHLQDPAPLLTETARVAKNVVIEVPLEDNVYTHIKVDLFKSRYREEIGHIQWFNKHNFEYLLNKTCRLKILSLNMVYLPDEILSFYGQSRNKLATYSNIYLRRLFRNIFPWLYPYLITDHCIALVCSNDTNNTTRS